MERLDSFSQKKVVFRFTPLASVPDGKRSFARLKPAAGFVIVAGAIKGDVEGRLELEFSIFDGPEFKVGERYACQIECAGIGKWEGDWTLQRINRLTERSLILRMESASPDSVVQDRAVVTEEA